jgi:hypothetical protein
MDLKNFNLAERIQRAVEKTKRGIEKVTGEADKVVDSIKLEPDPMDTKYNLMFGVLKETINAKASVGNYVPLEELANLKIEEALKNVPELGIAAISMAYKLQAHIYNKNLAEHMKQENLSETPNYKKHLDLTAKILRAYRDLYSTQIGYRIEKIENFMQHEETTSVKYGPKLDAWLATYNQEVNAINTRTSQG